MIFHTTLYNLPGARCLVAPHPSAPRIPGFSQASGQRRRLPSYSPGALGLGCAVASERGYCLCLEEYTSCTKETLSESPEPGLPLAGIGNTQPPTAHAQTGRKRRELHCWANAWLDRRSERRALLSSAPCRRTRELPRAPASPAQRFAWPVRRGARLWICCSPLPGGTEAVLQSPAPSVRVGDPQSIPLPT